MKNTFGREERKDLKEPPFHRREIKNTINRCHLPRSRGNVLFPGMFDRIRAIENNLFPTGERSPSSKEHGLLVGRLLSRHRYEMHRTVTALRYFGADVTFLLRRSVNTRRDDDSSYVTGNCLPSVSWRRNARTPSETNREHAKLSDKKRRFSSTVPRTSNSTCIKSRTE